MSELDEMKRALTAVHKKWYQRGTPFPAILNKLLATETDTCRIAVVKKEGKLPNNIYDEGINEPWRGEYSTAFRNGQRSLFDAGYVQEVT